MAYGFGATGGTGNSDKLTSAFSGGNTLRSWFFWANRQGNGQSADSSRIFQQSTRQNFVGDDVGGVFRFVSSWDTSDGQWQFSRPSNGVWFSIGVRYDWGSDANDPTVFSDSSKLQVGSGLTESFAPVGTPVTGGDLHIGNNVAGDRNWNGYVAEFAIWNALLTDAEFLSLASGYSPLFIRPGSLVEYLPLVRALSSRKVGPATVAAGTPLVQPHTRIIMPRSRPVRLGMPRQHIRPDADDTDGNWTNEAESNVNLFASIDEVTISDADFIQSETTPVNDLTKIRLSNPAETPAQPFEVFYRYKKATGGQIDLRVRLMQGNTQIAEWTHTDIADTFVTAKQTLSGGEFASITDFTDLFIEFRANQP